MQKRLFDCFTYFNETVMLEFRLRYLCSIVDTFVIVESHFTFTGARKPLSARSVLANLPKTIQDKIRLIEVQECPSGTFHQSCNWEREGYQRNAIMRGLYDLEDQDLILIADVDEIPDLQALEVFKADLRPSIGALNLCMHTFYYRADNQMYAGDEPVRWLLPKLVRPSHLLAPQTTRLAGKHFPSTNPVGWHFSYMGSNEQINYKIRSFSHQEFNTESIRSGIDAKRSSNQDPFGRDHTFKAFPHQHLPSLITTDSRFKAYFLPD